MDSLEITVSPVIHREWLKIALRSLAATVFLLVARISASAQANLGRILGSVTDQSGGVVGGATVTILDVQRGISRTLTTDSRW